MVAGEAYPEVHVSSYIIVPPEEEQLVLFGNCQEHFRDRLSCHHCNTAHVLRWLKLAFLLNNLDKARNGATA